MLKADLHPLRARSLKWDMLRADDFLLPQSPCPAANSAEAAAVPAA